MMQANIHLDLIFSRRIWHFPIDQVRLSLLTNQAFLSYIQDAFQFTHVAVDRIPSTGKRPGEYWPPGLLCEFGVMQIEHGADALPLAIRTLGIDAESILIEVGAGNDYTQEVFDRLVSMLEGTYTPEGAPAIGEFRSISDYSVFVVRSTNRLNETAVDGLVRSAMQQFFPDSLSSVCTKLEFARVPASGEIDEAETIWEMKPRFATNVSENAIESRAMLPSDRHRQLLESIFGERSSQT